MIGHIRQRPLDLNNTTRQAWTVSFRDSGSSPIGKREDLARNMVAEVAVGDAIVRNDFDHVSIFQRPIYNATWDTENKCWKDLVAKGEPGFTFHPTELWRQVVYRCTPFWYYIESDPKKAAGQPCLVSVSDKPLRGYKLAPMFKSPTQYEYRPCFEYATTYETPFAWSRSGETINSGHPFAIFDEILLCENGQTEGMADHFSDYLLLLVEFARRDLQSVMPGRCGRVPLILQCDDNFPFDYGFYVKEPGPLQEGDLWNFHVRCDNEVLYDSPTELITITPCELDGVHYGYRLEFSMDMDYATELLYMCNEAYLYPNTAQTGDALLAVTNATSGIAHNGFAAPCVWRGKENPWGNSTSVLYDVMLQTVGGKAYLCVLRDFASFTGSVNESYEKYGPFSISYENGDAILSLDLFDADVPLLLPTATSKAAGTHYVARVHIDSGTLPDDASFYLAFGCSCSSTIGTDNCASLHLISTDMTSTHCGARFVLEEKNHETL